MIVAAGLTPAWQQILVFDSFAVGEVNRAKQVEWCASGKVLNVGIALHHLGAASKTVALVGGESGANIRHEFAQLGAPARWVESSVPTRVCTTILDVTHRVTTELVEESRQPSVAELESFRRVFHDEARSADVVVLSGSLPPATPHTFYHELLEHTQGRVILDIRGPELLAALARRPFLVKPNREELARTCGRELSHLEDLVSAMRFLNKNGAEWVVVTHGADAVLAMSRGKTYRFQPPLCNVVNPIASGDCLAAGFAAASDAGIEPVAAIRFGVAAAVDNVGKLLPSRLDRPAIEKLAETVSVETLSADRDP